MVYDYSINYDTNDCSNNTFFYALKLNSSYNLLQLLGWESDKMWESCAK